MSVSGGGGVQISSKGGRVWCFIVESERNADDHPIWLDDKSLGRVIR